MQKNSLLTDPPVLVATSPKIPNLQLVPSIVTTEIETL